MKDRLGQLPRKRRVRIIPVAFPTYTIAFMDRVDTGPQVRSGVETPETERIEVPAPAPFELPAPAPEAPVEPLGVPA